MNNEKKVVVVLLNTWELNNDYLPNKVCGSVTVVRDHSRLGFEVMGKTQEKVIQKAQQLGETYG